MSLFGIGKRYYRPFKNSSRNSSRRVARFRWNKAFGRSSVNRRLLRRIRTRAISLFY